MRSDLPISEQWYQAAHKWADLESAAALLEDTKSSLFAEMVNKQFQRGIPMSVAKAELEVRASELWKDHVGKIIKARTLANKARIEMDFLRIKASEWQSQEANNRVQARL